MTAAVDEAVDAEVDAELVVGGDAAAVVDELRLDAADTDVEEAVASKDATAAEVVAEAWDTTAATAALLAYVVVVPSYCYARALPEAAVADDADDVVTMPLADVEPCKTSKPEQTAEITRRAWSIPIRDLDLNYSKLHRFHFQ